MNYEKIAYHLEDGIATITLSDPASLNATDTKMVSELIDVFKAAPSDARAIILTGAGRGFCSGANLATGETGEATKVDPAKLDLGAGIETHIIPLVTMIRDLPVPLVTAVNGPAVGIGCALALLGDMVIACESAYFLHAFARVGLVPDGGPTYLLPRLVGRARAMEMLMLASKVSAQQALEWGMINRCVPDAELMTTARDFANRFAQGPKALTMIRKLVWDSLDANWSEQLMNERRMQRDAGRTKDFVEGVAAFREKRPTRFTGQ
jgi:2-(1,2-epoxy-1,2-dihydrophenyl)acetyl-CoA isomerase